MQFILLLVPGFLLANTLPFTKQPPPIEQPPQSKEAMNRLQGYALYWKAYVDGLEFGILDDAYEIEPGLGGSITLASNYNLKEVPQSTNWGFKLDYNRTLNYDRWNLDLLWTRYYAQGQTANSRAEIRTAFNSTDFVHIGKDVNDIWSMIGQNPNPLFMQGKIHTHFNTLDLTLNKDFCYQEKLLLRTAIGAKGAIIGEELLLQTTDNGTYTPFPFASKMTIQNNFRGIGPLIGIVPRFLLGHGLSLDGQLFLSALWGQFDLGQRQTFNNVFGQNIPYTFTILNPRTISRIQPNINLCFDCNWKYDATQWAINLSAGYEISYWINYIRQNRITNTGLGSQESNHGKIIEQRRGDFVLQGLNLSAAISF